MRMMKFIRELNRDRWRKERVGGSISQNKQTDLRIPQGEVLSTKSTSYWQIMAFWENWEMV